MFDTTCANIAEWKRIGIHIPQSPFAACDDLSVVGVLTWEEHCVECGQPECFRNCKFFERSFDGKCRRFEYGIVPTCGMHVCAFRKWSKLEAVYTGRVRTRRRYRLWSAIDRAISSLARAVNQMMAFIPGRIGAITIYRRLKLWGERLLPGRKDCKLSGLLMRVWANRNVRLHISVVDGEHEIFTTAIELTEGWSEHNIATPQIGCGTRLLMFSTEDRPFTLVFSDLEGIVATGETKIVAKDNSSCGNNQSARFVKCIAWDLDNTLWKGTLVEDGVDNLVLNRDAERVIKELDKRGIVHTIISKNDHEPAWAALEKFGMTEYFIFPRINWLPKSGNIVAAARDININLNTFAFIDDSSFERGEVGEKCPQVRIFKETEIVSLPARPEFNPPISAESCHRRDSYRKEMQRVAAAAVFDGDYAAFLESCKIELSFFDLKSADEAEYERCYELIQRSNQLTLTGNRYSADEFKRLVRQSGVKAWGIRCKDKFGDYGIIGCVIAKEEGVGVWRIMEFVMSCRVAKKGCEAKAIEWVKSETRKLGGMSLKADFVDTGRNGALKEAFACIDWGS